MNSSREQRSRRGKGNKQKYAKRRVGDRKREREREEIEREGVAETAGSGECGKLNERDYCVENLCSYRRNITRQVQQRQEEGDREC